MRFLYNNPSSTKKPWGHWALLLLAASLLLGGCSTDSPTAPQQNGTPPPNGGGSATTFNITVTANPSDVPANSGTPISVTVSIRRADNGAPPPDGTTTVLTTTLGTFQSPTGPQSVSLSLLNGRAQATLFPSAVSGTARVRAQLQNSFGAANVRFSEAVDNGAFFLQSVTPSSGSPNGGTRVRIAGGGFVEPVRVFIGGQLAEVVSVSPTQVIARTPQITLPAGQTQAADVSVTVDVNGEDEATDTLPGAFLYRRDGGGALTPQIFSVTPSSGPNEGGTQVTIQGEGFASPIQVLFGTGAANAFNGVEAQIRSVSSTQIVVISPTATGFGQDNRDSNVSILVRNLDDGATALVTNAFAYGTDVIITALSPNVVSYLGGARVTISGQGFDEPVAVGAGGVGQTPISVTGTEILFRASAVAIEECQPVTASGAQASGPVNVTNVETGAFAEGPIFTYIGPSPPFINGVNPSTIDQEGGTLLTINGGNFEAPVQVTINGALSNVNSVSDDQVTLESPNIAGANFDTVGCNDDGDAQEGTRNIPTANNLSFNLTNVNTGCTTGNITVAFTVNPADITCQNDAAAAGTTEIPQADFDFVVNGDTASFTDQSTGGAPTSWTWDFGDGSPTSSAQNPDHQYAVTGMTYTVKLTVSNSAGSNAVSKNVDIP